MTYVLVLLLFTAVGPHATVLPAGDKVTCENMRAEIDDPKVEGVYGYAAECVRIRRSAGPGDDA